MFDTELFQRRVAELMAQGFERAEAELEATLEQEPDGDVVNAPD